MDGLTCEITGGMCPVYDDEIEDFDCLVECPVGRYEPQGVPAGYVSYSLFCIHATPFPREPHTQTH